MADLLEIQSVALLAVSDNSATNTALVGRTEKQQRNYQAGFKKLCEMIFAIAKMQKFFIDNKALKEYCL